MSRNWAPHVQKVAEEIEKRFGVVCTTYAHHGTTGEKFGIDAWIAPEGQYANKQQEALGDRIQKFVEDNWQRLGVHYAIYWGWQHWGDGWTRYNPAVYDRGNQNPVTQGHFDHFHLQIQTTPPKGGSPMPTNEPIWGVDIHPQFQAGIKPATIASEGFDFLVAKASQGNWQQLYGSREYVKQAQASGMVAGFYHFLDNDNVWRQVETFLEVVGNPEGKIICVDFEDPKDYGIQMRGAPTITDLYNFVYALRERLASDHPIWIYSAQWYFDRIGNPDITALMKDKNCIPWASRYTTATGYASQIYQSVPARWWNGEDNGGFGNQKPRVLQFTDRARVAGFEVDANAFRGSRAELEALVGIVAPEKPPTPEPEPEVLGRVIIGSKITPLGIKEGNAIVQNQRKQGRAARFSPFSETKEVDVWEPAKSVPGEQKPARGTPFGEPDRAGPGNETPEEEDKRITKGGASSSSPLLTLRERKGKNRDALKTGAERGTIHALIIAAVGQLLVQLGAPASTPEDIAYWMPYLLGFGAFVQRTLEAVLRDRVS